jgi:hypothetical protein
MKTIKKARRATKTVIWLVSVLTFGSKSDGIATRKAINIARKAAPVTRVNTAQSFQLGRSRYDAVSLFQLEPALYGGMPQSCPIFAFFRFTAQVMR